MSTSQILTPITLTPQSDSFTVFKQDGSHQFYCRWTVEEDKLLAKAVADHGPHKWTLVSKLIPGRTAVQCSTRWFGALNPNVHKGRWSKMEDKALTDAVQYFQLITPEENSLPWNRIAENIPHRTGIQCQARWTEALDPAVRKGRWHPEEDQQLKVAIEKYGCCWIRVASMIPTRTQRQCRTRWNQIHSQQLKASNHSPKKQVTHSFKSKSAPYPKQEFMPSKFPNESSINIKQEHKQDPCIIIAASPVMDERVLLTTGSNLYSTSPASSRSSSFSSSCMSPTSFPITPLSEQSIYPPQQVLFHENTDQSLVESFPVIMNNSQFKSDHQDSMSSFLNHSDLDFLLNFLE